MTVWESIIKDLQMWNKIKLSLSGRIAVIKMNVLPKLMFLFQTLPFINKRSILDKWQRAKTNFVWAGKRARIKFKALCDLKDNGGFQLPNLKFYFDAVGLSWLHEWIKLENRRLLKLEGNNLAYGWHAYLLYDKVKADRFFNHHLIRKVLFSIWRRYKNIYDQKRPIGGFETSRLWCSVSC